MIISASRRTDIPAYYGKWFINRLKSGSVLVRNPMNRRQVSRVILSPESVRCIVFWTKNPQPFLPAIPILEDLGYRYYFLFTVTPYGPEIEPQVPALSDSVSTFLELSSTISPERVIWRYDPIIMSQTYTHDFHLQQFSRLASLLSGATHRCIISFVRFYRKCLQPLRTAGAYEPSPQEMVSLVSQLNEIAREKGIVLNGCCMPTQVENILPRNPGCIDPVLISHLTGSPHLQSKERNQRKECRCMQSIDIGQYDSCGHQCIYCYANNSLTTVRRNMNMHNENSPLLYGSLAGDETITNRQQKDPRPVQPGLF